MINFEQAGALARGAILTYWHDAGTHPELCYAEFLSAGAKREVFTVLTEHHGVVRWRRGNFDRVLKSHEWRPACFDRALEFLENSEKRAGGDDSARSKIAAALARRLRDAAYDGSYSPVQEIMDANAGVDEETFGAGVQDVFDALDAVIAKG